MMMLYFLLGFSNVFMKKNKEKKKNLGINYDCF